MLNAPTPTKQQRTTALTHSDGTNLESKAAAQSGHLPSLLTFVELFPWPCPGRTALNALPVLTSAFRSVESFKSFALFTDSPVKLLEVSDFSPCKQLDRSSLSVVHDCIRPASTTGTLAALKLLEQGSVLASALVVHLSPPKESNRSADDGLTVGCFEAVLLCEFWQRHRKHGFGSGVHVNEMTSPMLTRTLSLEMSSLICCKE